MAALAMWMQETGMLSPDIARWMVICLAVIAFSMLVQALVYIVGGMAAMKAIKELKSSVDEARSDARASLEEVKAKVYPLVDGIMHIGRTAQTVVDEAAPKVKVATEHLVETSRIVREAAQKLSQTADHLSNTVTDANQKAQRQVARVDGMVTAALDTTAEVVATVEHGIKVPAQKIAQAITQARFVAEGLIERVKKISCEIPFLQPKTPRSSGVGATPPVTSTPVPSRPPTPEPAVKLRAAPTHVSGSVPIVK